VIPRINFENFGWFDLIYNYLRARYAYLNMKYNIVAFVQEDLYQIPQPSFAGQRFGKHRKKAGIARNKQKSVC
jgi:hypothetical protein